MAGLDVFWPSHRHSSPDSSLNKRFVKDYYARFNEYPDYMAGETYAGVYFIKAVIERAGTTEAGKIIEAVEKSPLSWETPEGWKTIGFSAESSCQIFLYAGLGCMLAIFQYYEKLTGADFLNTSFRQQKGSSKAEKCPCF